MNTKLLTLPLVVLIVTMFSSIARAQESNSFQQDAEFLAQYTNVIVDNS